MRGVLCLVSGGGADMHTVDIWPMRTADPVSSPQSCVGALSFGKSFKTTQHGLWAFLFSQKYQKTNIVQAFTS